MIEVLSDEETVVASDKEIAKLANAIFMTRIHYPETNPEAITQALWMVNGLDWMSASDVARARLMAKEKEAAHSV